VPTEELTMAKIVETRHCETAVALLKALSPYDDFWLSRGGAKEWLFRGQRDDEWKLVTSAMRPEALGLELTRITGMVSSPPHMFTTTRAHVLAEQDAVIRFFTGVLHAGLPVPEDSQLFRNKDIAMALVGGEARTEQLLQGVDVPLSLHRSLYALAQHHGIPTRLMDWTTSSFIAAYFASAEVARSLYHRKAPPSGTKGKNIAVFALCNRAIAHVERDHEPKGHEPSIDVVEAPYEDNPYWKAQKGVFTLLRYDTPRTEKDWRHPPLEDVLRGWCAHAHGNEDHEDDLFPFLVKFTVPVGESRKLLRLLADVGVSAPAVFPSYDSVRKGIEEEACWEDP